LSMKNLDLTMLGYRVTGWKGLPMMYFGNGRVATAHNVGWSGSPLTNIYTIHWLMNAYVQGWSWDAGYRLFCDPGDGSHIGNWEYAVFGDKIGYLEDSDIIYVQDEDCGVSGVDVEVHYFAPMQSAYRDSFAAVVIIKNTTAENKTIYFGLSNRNDCLKNYVAYSTSRNAVTSKNASEKTWIVGCSDTVDAAYLEGAWRTSDYVVSDPGTYCGYFMRWKFTINAGQTKVWTVINCFGNSEADALTLYNIMKSLNGQTLLNDNVHFWKDWLNEGKQWSTGIYEIDQLIRLLLCFSKASIDPDYYSMSACTTAYSTADWPPDTDLVFMGLALWGHLEEAKNYFAVRIKNIVDWIVANHYPLKDIHITTMYDFKGDAGCGYTGNEYFSLPIFAARVYKLCKDSAYASSVWSWLKVFMDDVDANLITSGNFEGCFNWNRLNVSAMYEDWWLGGPWTPQGTMCVSTQGTFCIAAAYDAAATVADAVGEQSLAASYRNKAKTMREKAKTLLWNASGGQYWDYWSDVEGCAMMYAGWGSTTKRINNWDMINSVPGLSGYVDKRIKESCRLFHFNLINLNKDPGLTDNYFPSGAKTNWMLGKTDPAPANKAIADAYLIGTMFTCVKAELDDLFLHWLIRISEEYGKADSFIFDESSVWYGAPSAGYTMRRTAGMFLMVIGDYFLRSKSLVQKQFENMLERFGSSVTVFKRKQSSVDSFGNPVLTYEAAFDAKPYVASLKANERVVAAGLFTTEDVRAEFKGLTPIGQLDRMKHGSFFYQVQTVQKHYFEDRLYRVECLCRRVAE